MLNKYAVSISISAIRFDCQNNRRIISQQGNTKVKQTGLKIKIHSQVLLSSSSDSGTWQRWGTKREMGAVICSWCFSSGSHKYLPPRVSQVCMDGARTQPLHVKLPLQDHGELRAHYCVWSLPGRQRGGKQRPNPQLV